MKVTGTGTTTKQTMNISILLRTWWCGRLVGKDSQGNKYYQDKKNKGYRGSRRWVIYNGQAEASKVPAPWHGWLHYTTDMPPSPLYQPYAWEKDHLPNLTGTPYAHHPREKQRSSADSHATYYKAWVPLRDPE